jgi:hypothetical protein
LILIHHRYSIPRSDRLNFSFSLASFAFNSLSLSFDLFISNHKVWFTLKFSLTFLINLFLFKWLIILFL